MVVDRRADSGGGSGGQALRHGEQDHAAMGRGEQAALGNRASRGQCRGKVEPTQQPIIGNVRRHPPQRGIADQELQ